MRIKRRKEGFVYVGHDFEGNNNRWVLSGSSYIYIYIFEEQKERRIVGKNLRYVILDFFSLSGDKKFTRKIFIFRYVISRGVDWKRGGDSRFLEQEWAQLCRESVRIAIFRKRSLAAPPKIVYLPPVEFSRGNAIYFVSLETLRASNRPVERGRTRLL